jgi:hypothetical protein
MDDLEIGRIRSCVGCGFCCIKSPCSAGARLYGSAVVRCASLEWRETRYYCKLMELPGSQGESYREELSAGAGCCSNLNSWRTDVKDRFPKDDTNIFYLDPIFQEFLNCLGREFVSSDSIKLSLYSMTDVLQKKGWAKENAVKVCSHIMKHIKQNRSRFMESFMP